MRANVRRFTRPHVARMGCHSAIVVIGNDKTEEVVAECEWDSLCCGDEEGADHTSPSSLSEPVCMHVASWELGAIHHVCLCSHAL